MVLPSFKWAKVIHESFSGFVLLPLPFSAYQILGHKCGQEATKIQVGGEEFVIEAKLKSGLPDGKKLIVKLEHREDYMDCGIWSMQVRSDIVGAGKILTLIFKNQSSDQGREKTLKFVKSVQGARKSICASITAGDGADAGSVDYEEDALSTEDEFDSSLQVVQSGTSCLVDATLHQAVGVPAPGAPLAAGVQAPDAPLAAGVPASDSSSSATAVPGFGHLPPDDDPSSKVEFPPISGEYSIPGATVLKVSAEYYTSCVSAASQTYNKFVVAGAEIQRLKAENEYWRGQVQYYQDGFANTKSDIETLEVVASTLRGKFGVLAKQHSS